MGNIIGLKPIIFMDSDGVMKTKAKCRGRGQSLNKILDYVEELQEDMRNHRVIIAHADAEDIALELADLFRKRFGDDIKIEFDVVNPTAGSHCGPNTVGISFHAKHR